MNASTTILISNTINLLEVLGIRNFEVWNIGTSEEATAISIRLPNYRYVAHNIYLKPDNNGTNQYLVHSAIYDFKDHWFDTFSEAINDIVGTYVIKHFEQARGEIKKAMNLGMTKEDICHFFHLIPET